MTPPKSSGSSLADSAVEPTRSMNITVRCRRSAASAPKRSVAVLGAVAAAPRPTIALNPGGSPEATRRAFNKRFLLDLAEDWQQHGREVFKRVRRESPASYLKVCAMLVPKELKFEHSGGVKAMSDEQIERAIEFIKAMIAQQDAGANAELIEGEAEVVPSLPPARPTKAS